MSEPGNDFLKDSGVLASKITGYSATLCALDKHIREQAMSTESDLFKAISENSSILPDLQKMMKNVKVVEAFLNKSTEENKPETPFQQTDKKYNETVKKKPSVVEGRLDLTALNSADFHKIDEMVNEAMGAVKDIVVKSGIVIPAYKSPMQKIVPDNDIKLGLPSGLGVAVNSDSTHLSFNDTKSNIGKLVESFVEKHREELQQLNGMVLA